MRKKNRTGKRLRLIPLIVGGYGAFLGLGLAAAGLFEYYNRFLRWYMI